jgi:hypothetical protein
MEVLLLSFFICCCINWNLGRKFSGCMLQCEEIEIAEKTPYNRVPSKQVFGTILLKQPLDNL